MSAGLEISRRVEFFYRDFILQGKNRLVPLLLILLLAGAYLDWHQRENIAMLTAVHETAT